MSFSFYVLDLQKIEKRISSKEYSRLNEFIYDVKRLFDNCYYYNGMQSPFSHLAKNLENFFNQKFKQLISEV